MNNPADFLSNIARAGLGVAPLTAHGIKATGPCKVAGRHISDASNEPEPSSPRGLHRIAQGTAHAIKRESTGCGMTDYARMVCSCGWVGEKRYQSDDFMSTRLADDERGHLASR